MGVYDDKPKGKRGSGPAPAGAVGADAPFRGYINVGLDDEQKADYAAWSASEAIWEALEREASGGVHLSLRRDARSSGYLASATQRDSGSPNAGLVVTARGRTAAVAWGRLLFILDVLARFKRWEDCQPVADPDRW